MQIEHHKDGPVCLLCNLKLEQSFQPMKEWFLRIKKVIPDVHISWSYRNKADQDQFFSEGKSKLKYPKSKHNFTNARGEPCSEALDLFRQVNGKDLSNEDYYRAIADLCIKNNDDIACGLFFKSLGDGNHFEYHEKT